MPEKWIYKTYSGIGRKFGEWTALGPARKRPNNLEQYNAGLHKILAFNEEYYCKCTCGTEHWVSSANLCMGLSQRCNDCRMVKQAARVLAVKMAKIGTVVSNRLVQSYDQESKLYTVVCTDCGQNKKLPSVYNLGKCRCMRVDKPHKKKSGQIVWNGQDMTYNVVGEILGISKQRISQIVLAEGAESIIRRLQEKAETLNKESVSQ